MAIADGKITVEEGHVEIADLKVQADSKTWLKIASKEISSLWPVLTGKLKISGNPMQLVKFQNFIEN